MSGVGEVGGEDGVEVEASGIVQDHDGGEGGNDLGEGGNIVDVSGGGGNGIAVVVMSPEGAVVDNVAVPRNENLATGSGPGSDSIEAEGIDALEEERIDAVLCREVIAESCLSSDDTVAGGEGGGDSDGEFSPDGGTAEDRLREKILSEGDVRIG